MDPLVSIVIPVYNQINFTKACLDSLLADLTVLQIAEIIIVDDGSVDQTESVITTKYSSAVKYIRLDRNSGFSVACNTGAAAARSKELLFLNNDTEPQSGWLEILRKSLNLRAAGIVGPKLLYPGSLAVNHAGYVYGEKMGGFYSIYEHYPADFAGVCRRRDFQALLGACILIRKELFQRVGGFSAYGLEDIDLCLKVRERGLRVIYEPSATVLHHGSVTLRDSKKYTFVQTDVAGFSKRWPKSSLIQDDEIYYSEDGFSLVEIKNHTPFLKETVSESNQLLNQAVELGNLGSQEAAHSLISKSIELYLGNLQAYHEMVSLHLDSNDLTQAVYWLEKLCLHCNNTSESKLLLAKLYTQLGKLNGLKSILEDLLSDWQISNDQRERASKLLSTSKHP